MTGKARRGMEPRYAPDKAFRGQNRITRVLTVLNMAAMSLKFRACMPTARKTDKTVVFVAVYIYRHSYAFILTFLFMYIYIHFS